MSTPIPLTRHAVSRQLGGVEWRWPSDGSLAVFVGLDDRRGWTAREDPARREYLKPLTYHPDPESAARSVGATTEEP